MKRDALGVTSVWSRWRCSSWGWRGSWRVRRHRSALEQVDREIAAGRYGTARRSPDRAVDSLDGAG